MGSKDRNTGKRKPRPSKSAGKGKTPAKPPDIAPEAEVSLDDVQFAEGNDLGSGRGDLPEELETDGPVMGGPGMMRTGADRAISTGTGGLAAGEDLDPVAEGDYWRENFRRRPYYQAEREFSHYEPAYRYGWERAGLSEYRNRSFEEVELDLRSGWESEAEPEAGASWADVRDPARDAFERARSDRSPKHKKEDRHGSRSKS